MKIDIGITVDNKEGLMGVPLSDIQKPVIKKKKKVKKKNGLLASILSAIPVKPKYTTEEI
jgi:hypothetical protein